MTTQEEFLYGHGVPVDVLEWGLHIDGQDGPVARVELKTGQQMLVPECLVLMRVPEEKKTMDGKK